MAKKRISLQRMISAVGQRAACERLGISQAHASRLARGVCRPSARLLVRAAEVWPGRIDFERSLMPEQAS